MPCHFKISLIKRIHKKYNLLIISNKKITTSWREEEKKEKKNSEKKTEKVGRQLTKISCFLGWSEEEISFLSLW